MPFFLIGSREKQYCKKCKSWLEHQSFFRTLLYSASPTWESWESGERWENSMRSMRQAPCWPRLCVVSARPGGHPMKEALLGPCDR